MAPLGIFTNEETQNICPQKIKSSYALPTQFNIFHGFCFLYQLVSLSYANGNTTSTYLQNLKAEISTVKLTTDYKNYRDDFLSLA